MEDEEGFHFINVLTQNLKEWMLRKLIKNIYVLSFLPSVILSHSYLLVARDVLLVITMETSTAERLKKNISYMLKWGTSCVKQYKSAQIKCHWNLSHNDFY